MKPSSQFCLLFLFFIPITNNFSQSNCPCGVVMVKHQHRIIQHPSFSSWTTLKEQCAVDGAIPFYVTADGTESSKFELEISIPANCQDPPVLGDVYFLDENFSIVTNGDPDEYGEMLEVNINGYMGEFVYKHPLNYPMAGEKARVIRIGIFDENDLIRAVLAINIYRIPVIMVHGLWSSAGSFDNMADDFKGDEYQDFLIRQVDYSGSAGGAFETNSNDIPAEIFFLVESCRANETAIGKVNLVGHSMGGLLARLHLGSTSYHQMVNRLVTCNTPHAGSQLANFLDTRPDLCDAISQVMAGSDCSSAITDLSVGSIAMQDLNNLSHPAEVGIHAVHTQQTILPSFVANSYIIEYKIGALLGYPVNGNCLLEIFGNDTHDLVVASESQKGGLAPSQLSFVDNQMHMGSTANQSIISIVKDLFDEAPNSAKFATGGFDPPDLQYSAPPCTQFILKNDNVVQINSSSAATLQIDTPLQDMIFVAGDSISINYTASSEIDSVVAMFAYSLDSMILYKTVADGMTIKLPIPVNSKLVAGTVLLYGLDNAGDYVTNDWKRISISTVANLLTLAVTPEEIFLNDEYSENLSIQGVYDDGVVRDLSMQDIFSYTFLEGNAGNEHINEIVILNPGDDEFTLSFGGVISNNVKVNYRPPCDKLDNSWIGPIAGASWHDTENNWSLGKIPDLCDHVIIPASNTVSIEPGQNAYCYALTVDLGAELIVDLTTELLVITEQ